MAFGHNCEHDSLNACVKAMTGKTEDPRGFCIALMWETELQCRAKALIAERDKKQQGK